MNAFLARFARPWLRATAIAAAAILVASCGGGDETPAPPALFSTTVVMGASVSDTGNVCPTPATAGCPPVPPYAQGRFSNGTLWVETVAARYGATVLPSSQGGTNFAHAGATTGTVPGTTVTNRPPSMVQQLDQHLTRANFVVRPETLYIIDGVTVGNNIADALAQVLAGNANAPAAVITQAVTDIVGMVHRLYAAGARHVVILNAPDIGKTPRVTAPNNPVAAAGATQMSQQFNGALAQQITGLRAVLSNLNIYAVDVFAFEAAFFAAPGTTNITAPCVNTTVVPPTVCQDPSQFYYWDPFHPTVATGARLAAEVIRVIGR